MQRLKLKIAWIDYFSRYCGTRLVQSLQKAVTPWSNRIASTFYGFPFSMMAVADQYKQGMWLGAYFFRDTTCKTQVYLFMNSPRSFTPSSRTLSDIPFQSQRRLFVALAHVLLIMAHSVNAFRVWEIYTMG